MGLLLLLGVLSTAPAPVAAQSTQLSISRQCSGVSSCEIAEEGDTVSVLVSAPAPLQDSAILEITVDPIQTQTLESNDVFPMQAQIPIQAGQSSVEWVFVVEEGDGPELNETFAFRLELLAPVAGVSVDQDSFIITVPPNENPYGTIALLDLTSSGSTVVAEGSILVAILRRTGGRFGQQEVAWEIEGGQADFAPAQGTVVFDKGDSSVNLLIPVTDDAEPELDEQFALRLLRVISGGASLAATPDQTNIDVTVTASDFPLGRFSFTASTASGQESSNGSTQPTELTLYVGRDGGALGPAQLRVVAFATNATALASLPASVPRSWNTGVLLNESFAKPNADFTPLSTTLDFATSQRDAAVSVNILADTIPEPNEAFLVQLLLADDTTQAVGDTTVLLTANTTVLAVIGASDVAGGRFQFADGAMTPPALQIAEPPQGAREPATAVFNITRSAPAYGTARVVWTATSSTTGATVSSSVDVAAGQTVVQLQFEVQPDNVPELEEVWTITLTDAVSTSFAAAQAQLGTSTTALVRVPPNDNPNGVLAVSAFPESPLISEGGTPLIVDVTRGGGTFGTVSVAWSITSVDDDASGGEAVERARNNLAVAEGTLVFAPNQVRQEIIVTAVEDQVPELPQRYVLRLANPTGGAVLATEDEVDGDEGNDDRLEFSVEASDTPLGAFEFGQTSFVVREPTASPSRTVAVPIIRTGAALGDVVVTYSIQPFSSTSSDGLLPATRGSDYVGAVSMLVFLRNETSKLVSLSILHDTEPEPDEALQLTLDSVRPVDASLAGTAMLGDSSATTCTVVIPANDMASGVFSFEDPAVERVVVEEPEEPASNSPTNQHAFPQLTVLRAAGAFGTVTVGWRLETQDPANFAYLSGNVTFGEGMTSAALTIPLLPDSVPEVRQEHVLHLISLNGGFANLSSFADNAAATRKVLVVPASDDANGILGLDVTLTTSPIILREPFAPGDDHRQAQSRFNTSIAVPIIRTAGAFGTVAVTWTVFAEQRPDDGSSSVPSSSPAPPPAFTSTSGTFTFSENERRALITLRVADDTVPEQRAAFTLRLSNATGGARIIGSVPSIDNAINSSTGELALEVLASDDPFGVIRLDNASSQTRFPEEAGVLVIPLARAKGLVGTVAVDWQLRSAVSASVTSLSPSSGTVTFPEGVRRAGIYLNVTDDDVPEFQEEFVLALTEVTGGARRDTAQVATTLILEASDYPHGFFTATLYSGDDSNEGNATNGQNNASPDARPNASTAANTTTGNAPVPFAVTLEDGTSAQVVSAVTVSEPSALSVTVRRAFGSNGRVRVPLRFVLPQTHARNATATSADVRLSAKSVTFEDGESTQTVVLSILNDTLPELNENLWLALGTPSLLASDAAVPAAPVAATAEVLQVTVLENGDPYGVPELVASQLAAREGEMVTVDVIRTGGLLGTITVEFIILLDRDSLVAVDKEGGSIRLAPASFADDVVSRQPIVAVTNEETTNSTTNTTAAPPPTTRYKGTVAFGPGVQLRQLAFAIEDDAVPEVGEGFAVQLGTTTTPAGQLATSRREKQILVHIAENDNVRGVFRFAAASLVADLNTVAETNRTLSLTVQRMTSAVGLSLVPFKVLAGDDGASGTSPPPASEPPIVPTAGVVVFEDGQGEAELELRVVDDDVPEFLQTVEVVISPPQGSAEVVADASSAVVTVLPNDDPLGLINLAAAVITASPTHRNFTATLVRSAGTNGAIRVEAALGLRTGHGDSISSGSADVVAGACSSTKALEAGLPDALTLDFAEGQQTATVVVDIPAQLPLFDSQARLCVDLLQATRSDGTLLQTPQGASPRLGQFTSRVVEPPREARFGRLTWRWSHTGNATTSSNSSSAVGIDIDQASNSTRASVVFREEHGSVGQLLVRREGGTFGDIALDVVLTHAGLPSNLTGNSVQAPLAETDITTAAGVALAHGQQEVLLSIAPVDDTLPELQEQGTWVLLLAAAGNSPDSNSISSNSSSDRGRTAIVAPLVTGSPPTVVSLNGQQHPLLTVTITVQANDDAFGVAQIVKPAGAVDFIRSLGSASVTLERSVGLFGSLTVLMSFRAATAMGEALPLTADAVNSTVAVVFEGGQGRAELPIRQTATLPVQSLATGLPDNVVFSAYIDTVTNPLGAPRVGDRDSATFVLRSCADCVVGLRPAAQGPPSLVALREGQAFNVTLYRTPTAYDAVRASWAISPSTDDILPSSGTVNFAAGQFEATVGLSIQDDAEPELLERFVVQVTAVEGVDISVAPEPESQVDVAVLANDNVYGSFGFVPRMPPVPPLVVSEGDGGNGEAVLVVQRRVSSEGHIWIDVDTSDGILDLFDKLQATNSSSSSSSNSSSGGVVTWSNAYETGQVVTVSGSSNKSAMEAAAECARACATYVAQEECIGFQVPAAINASHACTLFLGGVIQQAPKSIVNASSSPSTSTSTSEASPSPSLNDTRLSLVPAEGDSTSVYVRKPSAAFSSVAIEGHDFVGVHAVLEFAPGEVEKAVAVTILNDAEPELMERLTVQLNRPRVEAAGDSVMQVEMLGDSVEIADARSAQDIYIRENDDPYGRFEIAADTVSVQEGATVAVGVTRFAGTFEGVSIVWNLSFPLQDQGGCAPADFAARSLGGVLHFAASARSMAAPPALLLNLTASDDGTPELSESALLSITVAAGSKGVVGTQSSASVVVPANDFPGGSFIFDTQDTLQLGEGTATTVLVSRVGGTLTPARVALSLALTNVSRELFSSMSTASLGLDTGSNVLVSPDTLHFEVGEINKTVTVSVADDAEPNVGYEVAAGLQLLGVEEGEDTARVGQPETLLVRVQQDDAPSGRFSLLLTSAQSLRTEQSPSFIVVGEGANVTATVRRAQGAVGRVEIQLSRTRGMLRSSDVLMVVEEAEQFVNVTQDAVTVAFDEGQRELNISLSVVNDRSAEPAEWGEFSLEVVSAAYAANIDTIAGSGNVTVLPSDNAFDFGRFSIPVGQAVQEGSAALQVVRSLGVLGVVDVAARVRVPTVINAISPDDLQVSHASGNTSGDGSGMGDDAPVVVVRFSPGTVEQTVMLPIRADGVPEGRELALVELVQCTLVQPQGYDAGSGAGPKCDTTAQLVQVLPNDNVDGVFSILVGSAGADDGSNGEMPEDMAHSLIVEEGKQFRVYVVRGVSALNPVTACWQAFPRSGNATSITTDKDNDRGKGEEGNNSSGMEAHSVFALASGCTVLAAGETQASTLITVIDDTEPEITEAFGFALTATNGTSSISTTGGVAQVSVVESDTPGGVFEVRAPADDSGSISVAEGHVFDADVVRTTAALKRVTVEWAIEHDDSRGHHSVAMGTEHSTSPAVPGADAPEVRFNQTRGNITFAMGQTTATIPVLLRDDGVPNTVNTYSLRLVRTLGTGSGIGTQSQVAVVAHPDDDRVAFEQPGATIVMNEDTQDEADKATAAPSNTSVWVLRLDTATGAEVQVEWQLVGPATTQFLQPHTGVLTFVGTEAHLPIHLSLVSDALPELAQSAMLRLTSVSSNAVLAGNGVQEVRVHVMSSDAALGVFEFSTSSLAVKEGQLQGDAQQSLSVVRVAGSGAHGVVQVHLQAVATTPAAAAQAAAAAEMGRSVHDRLQAHADTLPPELRAKPSVDYVLVSTAVTLGPSTDSASVEFNVIEDSAPELTEFFSLEIVDVELLGIVGDTVADANASLALNQPPQAGSIAESTVAILENDDARGVVRFAELEQGDGHGQSQPMLSCSEGGSACTVHLVRDIEQGGLFGNISVYLAADATSATLASRTTVLLAQEKAAEATSSSSTGQGAAAGALPAEWVNVEREFSVVQFDEQPEVWVSFVDGRTLFSIAVTRERTALYTIRPSDGRATRRQVLDSYKVRSLAAARIHGSAFVFVPVYSTGNMIFPSRTFSTLYRIRNGYLVPSDSLETINPTCAAFALVDTANGTKPFLLIGSNYNRDANPTGGIRVLSVSETGEASDVSTLDGTSPTSLHVATVDGATLVLASSDTSHEGVFELLANGTLRQVEVQGSMGGDGVTVAEALHTVTQWTHHSVSAIVEDVVLRTLLIGARARNSSLPPAVLELKRNSDASGGRMYLQLVAPSLVPGQLGLPASLFGVTVLQGEGTTSLAQPAALLGLTRASDNNATALAAFRYDREGARYERVAEIGVADASFGLGATSLAEWTGFVSDDIVPTAPWAAHVVDPTTSTVGLALVRVVRAAGDAHLLQRVVHFAEGQERAEVALSILDDQLPESAEELSLSIVAVESGARVDRERNRLDVVVPSSDRYFGTFGFSRDTLQKRHVYEEPDVSSLRIPLTIERGGLANGPVTVAWQASVDGQPAPRQLLRENAGKLVFGQGERSKDVPLAVLPDDLPEVTAQVSVQLQTVGAGAGVAAEGASVELTFVGSDNPSGGVFLATPGAEGGAVTCEEGQEVTVVVRRLPDAYGPITAALELTPLSEGATQQDLVPLQPLENIVLNSTLGKRTVEALVVLQCATDTIDELQESFRVSVSALSENGVALFQNSTTAVITLAPSGQPYGMVNVSADAQVEVVAMGAEDAVLANGSKRALLVDVARAGGVFGEVVGHVSVAYRPSQGIAFQERRDMLALAIGGSTATLLREGEHARRLQVPLLNSAQLLGDAEVRVTLSEVRAVSPDDPSDLKASFGTFMSVAVVPEDAAGGLVRLTAPGLQPLAEPQAENPAFADLSGALVVQESSGQLTIDFEWQRGRFKPFDQGPGTLSWRLAPASMSSSSAPSSMCATPAKGLVEVASSMRVSLTIQDDMTPEEDELCLLQLSLNNASWLQLETTSVLAVVVASDNPAGTVYLTADAADGDVASSLFIATDLGAQGQTAVLGVQREAGTLADVRVAFTLTYTAPNTTLFASSPSSATTWQHEGSVTLLQGEARARAEVRVPSTLRLEVDGVLRAVLTRAELTSQRSGSLSEYADGVGPSVDAARSSAAVAVASSIFTYGRVSLGSDIVSAQENQGSVEVTVLRDTASSGKQEVLWSLEEDDGSARAGEDFVSQSGVLILDSRQTQGSLSFDIVDDDEPESRESFIVRLTTVVGGAVLGRATTRVVISANDGAAGLFAFVNASAPLTVEENAAVTLSVRRSRGSFGAVSVFWQVEHQQRGGDDGGNQQDSQQQQQAGDDLSPVQGIFEFAAGQTTATVTISVLDDNVPEEQEQFLVSLTRLVAEVADQAAIDDAARSVLMEVPPSDEPYGVLGLSTVTARLQATEGARRHINFDVVRAKGTAATVFVTCVVQLNVAGGANSSTAADTQLLGSLAECPAPSTVDTATAERADALVTQDCLLTVELLEGQARRGMQLDVADATALKFEREVHVYIERVQLASGVEEASVSAATGQAIFAITEDVADGTVQVAQAQETVVTVEEADSEDTRIELLVERQGGTYVPRLTGALLVPWSLRSVGSEDRGQEGDGAEVTDVAPISGILAFAPGQSMTSISLSVLADTVPEGPEEFVVELTLDAIACPGRTNLPCASPAATPPGVVSQERRAVTLVVAASDDPLGVVQLAEDSVAVLAEDGEAELQLIREGGLANAFSVGYRAFKETYDTAFFSEQGSVSFASGQTTATVVLSIPPGVDRSGSALLGNFTLILQGTNGTFNGARLGPRRTASVTVLFSASQSPGSDGNTAGPILTTASSSGSGASGKSCVVAVPRACLGLSNPDIFSSTSSAQQGAVANNCLREVQASLDGSSRVCSDSLYFMHSAMLTLLQNAGQLGIVGSDNSAGTPASAQVVAAEDTADTISLLSLRGVAQLLDALLEQRQPQPWLDSLLQAFGAVLLADCGAREGQASCACSRDYLSTRVAWSVARALPNQLNSATSSLPIGKKTVRVETPPFLGDVLRPGETAVLQAGDTSNVTGPGAANATQACEILVTIAFLPQQATFPLQGLAEVVDGVVVDAGVVDADLDALRPTNTFSFSYSPSTDPDKLREPACAYWDGEQWLQEGCSLDLGGPGSDRGLVRCKCEHMAYSYAIHQQRTDEVPVFVIVGTGLVIAGSGALLIAHLMWARCGRAGAYRQHMLVALLLLSCFFVFGAYTARVASVDETLAFAAGLCTHYFMLVTLSAGMAATAVGTRQYQAQDLDTSRARTGFSALFGPVMCWLVPAFVVGIYLAVTLDGGSDLASAYGDVGRLGRACFLKQELGIYVAAVAPVGVALLVSLAFVARVERDLCRFSRREFAIEQGEGITTPDALLNLRVGVVVQAVVGLALLGCASFSAAAVVVWAVALFLLGVLLFVAAVVVIQRQRHSGRASVVIPDSLGMKEMGVGSERKGQFRQPTPGAMFQRYLDGSVHGERFSPARVTSTSPKSVSLDMERKDTLVPADETTAEFDDLIAVLASATPGMMQATSPTEPHAGGTGGAPGRAARQSRGLSARSHVATGDAFEEPVVLDASALDLGSEGASGNGSYLAEAANMSKVSASSASRPVDLRRMSIADTHL